MEIFKFRCKSCESELVALTVDENARLTKISAVCPDCAMETTYSEAKARRPQLEKVDPAQTKLPVKGGRKQ